MASRLPWIILILLILTLLLPLAWLALKPTGSYINPLPRSNQAATPQGDPLPEQGVALHPLAFYLGTTQTSLAKARQLANGNDHQTDTDKQLIISTLNQALASANQAVAAYPQDPRSYQQRAEVLLSVAHLNPQAKTLAEQDLATAQSLAGGQTSPLPPANPLDALPLEQANLAQNVVIALPAQTATLSAGAPASNIIKDTVILPAGQTELKTDNWKLETDSAIYLIPQGNTLNHPVYVKSKTSASFTLAIDQPLDSDLTIDYWIINP